MANELVRTDQALIQGKIATIRGVQVMLDRDVAELYGVPTKVLNQTVKRNMGRFPDRFMFQVTKEELENLRSQFVTSSWGGMRYCPYAFTEHGIMMLASMLKSDIDPYFEASVLPQLAQKRPGVKVLVVRCKRGKRLLPDVDV